VARASCINRFEPLGAQIDRYGPHYRQDDRSTEKIWERSAEECITMGGGDHSMMGLCRGAVGFFAAETSWISFLGCVFLWDPLGRCLSLVAIGE